MTHDLLKLLDRMKPGNTALLLQPARRSSWDSCWLSGHSVRTETHNHTTTQRDEAHQWNHLPGRHVSQSSKVTQFIYFASFPPSVCLCTLLHQQVSEWHQVLLEGGEGGRETEEERDLMVLWCSFNLEITCTRRGQQWEGDTRKLCSLVTSKLTWTEIVVTRSKGGRPQDTRTATDVPRQSPTQLLIIIKPYNVKPVSRNFRTCCKLSHVSVTTPAADSTPWEWP